MFSPLIQFFFIAIDRAQCYWNPKRNYDELLLSTLTVGTRTKDRGSIRTTRNIIDHSFNYVGLSSKFKVTFQKLLVRMAMQREVGFRFVR